MKKAYIISDNILNSLGFNSTEVFNAIMNGRSGISKIDDPSLSPSPIPLSIVDTGLLEEKFSQISGKAGNYTRMEKMFIVSIADAMRRSGRALTGKDTLLIISTTKGNIDLLNGSSKDVFQENRTRLWKMADEIAGFFGFANRPVVISNACISGVMALNAGYHFIRSGQYKNVVVAGGDMVTEFVVSGFLSFQALSQEPCKPFDNDRTGLNIGEGSATVVLSDEPTKDEKIHISGSAVTNDANHISGPSRTGEELALAISRSLQQSGIDAGSLDYISAHGTATPYNDEMESKAIGIAGAQQIPVNSFKGYWGHTLGAAGVMESVAVIHSMKKRLLIKSIGFENPGTPEPLNVITENKTGELINCLKIASGFGGCNGAIIFQKEQ